jgi:hypothetical protein
MFRASAAEGFEGGGEMIDLNLLEFGKHRKPAAKRKGKQRSLKRDSMKAQASEPDRMPEGTHADGAKA